jgi:hypothetical protein
MDRRTHGLLTKKPPAQTYCGLSADDRVATTDPFIVDCNDCKKNMIIAGVLPDPNFTTQRGRPKGSGKKGWFS